MHMMQARACGQPPLRQTLVFSPVPNGSGYPLLCHGNILLTRPSPLVKGVLTREPGRRGAGPRSPLPRAAGVQPRRGSWRVFRPAAVAKLDSRAPEESGCLGASDRKYGDVSPVPRAAPRTPGASTPPLGGYPMPARPYTGSARGSWILAADVSVIVLASVST